MRAMALEKQHQVNGMNGHMARNQLDTEAEEEARYTDHLRDAFQAWKALPEKQKQEAWRTEALRAYTREQEKRHEADARLQRVEQEVQHLRAQVSQLSKCQQPREFVLFPPTTLPLPTHIAKAASETAAQSGFDTADWDYDRLVAKWKSRLRGDRNNRLGGQQPLPNSAPIKSWNFSTPGANGTTTAAASTPRLLLYPEHHAPPRRGDSTEDADHEEDYEEDGGADMEDAAGEEEEEEDGARVREAMMGRGVGVGVGVLDPSLRGQGQGQGQGKGADEVMEGIEGDGGEGFGGGGLLSSMGMRDYGGLNGGLS